MFGFGLISKKDIKNMPIKPGTNKSPMVQEDSTYYPLYASTFDPDEIKTNLARDVEATAYNLSLTTDSDYPYSPGSGNPGAIGTPTSNYPDADSKDLPPNYVSTVVPNINNLNKNRKGHPFLTVDQFTRLVQEATPFANSGKWKGKIQDWSNSDALLNLIRNESGFSPLAQNPTSTAFGLGQFLNCVPLATEILTRTGWKKYYEVCVGEETLAYNFSTKQSEWTKIKKIFVSDGPSPLVEMRDNKNKFNFACTPNHKWLTQDKRYRSEILVQCPICGKFKSKRKLFTNSRQVSTHVWKAHGVRLKPELMQNEEIKLKETSGLNKHFDSLLLSAKVNQSQNILTLTNEEAALIGWILGEGHITQSKKAGFSVIIYQSKLPQVKYLQQLMKNFPHSEYTRQRGENYLIEHAFHLSHDYAKDLFKRSGVLESGPIQFVLNLNNDQLLAFMEAVYLREGNCSDYSRPGLMRISQKEGQVQDAFTLGGFLLGFSPHFYEVEKKEEHYKQISTVSFCKPTVRMTHLNVQELPPDLVWCVETELGSWTARQGKFMTLTGNSTWSTYGIDKTPDPLRQLVATLRYIASRYGTPDVAWSFWQSQSPHRY